MVGFTLDEDAHMYSHKSSLSRKGSSVLKQIHVNNRYSAEWIKECIMFQWLKIHGHDALMRCKNLHDDVITMPYYRYTLANYDIFSLSEDDKIHIFYRLCSAISHLHHHNIVHTDLKPDNIFMNTVHDVCIGDYDNVIFYAHRTQQIGILQTINYRAPEVIGINISINTNTKKSCDIKKIDIWSLGVIAVYLFTGIQLIPNEVTTNQELYEYLNKIYKSSYITNTLNQLCINSTIKKLIYNMLRFNPNDRIDIDIVISMFEKSSNFLQKSSIKKSSNLLKRSSSLQRFKVPSCWSTASLPKNWDTINSIIDEYVYSQELPYYILALAIEYTYLHHKYNKLTSFNSEVFDLCLSKAEKIYGFNCYYDDIDFKFQPYFTTNYDKLCNDILLKEQTSMKSLDFIDEFINTYKV